MIKSLRLWVLIATLLGMLSACAQPVSSEVIRSEKPRVTSAQANQSDLAALVDGNSAFGFNLYQVLKNSDGNLFYSPYSILLALAMTYAGARSDTAQQMSNTLRFTLPQNRLHPVFNSLDVELHSRGQGAKGKDDKGFRLNIVNAIWGQQGFKFLPEFLDVLAENYGAGLRPLDFTRSSEDSRIKINEWVSDQTEKRIKDLLAQGTVTPATRLVLTNAIYFNVAWQYQFKKDATQNGTFNLLDSTKITVPMMKQTEMLNYAEGSGYQVIELPYSGRELSMVIIVPRAGNFRAVEGTLDMQRMTSAMKDLKATRVALTMPRFKFESSFSLNETLAKMGMPIAFSGGADFSGMTGNRDLFISNVIHKAFVATDEDGTEAAAATAVVMPTSMPPSAIVEVTLDRPFLFLIRDVKTGAILFMGRILNPGT